MNQEQFTRLTSEIAKIRTGLLIVEDIIETIMLEKSDVLNDLFKIQQGTYQSKTKFISDNELPIRKNNNGPNTIR